MFRWLFRLVLAMDANFRLKNRLRPRSRTDPGLGTGWAYFVEDDEYRDHILQYVTQEEVRTIHTCSLDSGLNAEHYLQISNCSGFEALSNANSKNSRGLRSTGVGAVICSRHSFWRPNGIGDLQKGER